ncbi:hypothetical protein Ddye_006054 [Dipteronia dyeriana]|uniref:DUF1985 domain-containing protein n=1 Tax=Dipteronia dyeriana TaxID=168575 RepID=A0AAD9XHB0_9ROSI|nr:hypothetical protein Ddye_006054 [Dipteronia dyeriana]
MIMDEELLKTPEEEWYEGKLTRQYPFDGLGRIDDALNQVPVEFVVEDYRQFMASCFGHFMMMYRRVKFLSVVIHRLLLRKLHLKGPSYEIQFIPENQVVRFSKVQFCMITGLRFGDVPYTSWDNITFEEFRVVLSLSEFQQAYDSVKLCLLYMLNWILMGLDERVKIPVRQFRLVEGLDAFDTFPWGDHVYSHSIFSFKYAIDRRRERFERRQQSKGANVYMLETYNIYDRSYALLIFAFKVILEFGIQFGRRRATDLSPSILKWELNKQSRADKLSKIFTTRIFTRTEFVPTEAEMGELYYVSIEEAILDPLSVGKEAISDLGSVRLSDTEGSKPEHGRGSLEMHSNPELGGDRHRRQKLVRFRIPVYTVGDHS